MGDGKGGMTPEDVNAMKFIFELQARDMEASNKIKNDLTESLLEENEVLREENFAMKIELMDLHQALNTFKYYSMDKHERYI